MLPYKAARDKEDEKHIHPLQLDVIERLVLLYSNPGETVLTPFMGVGSEVYGALLHGRKGIGIDLKPSYYRQAKRNIEELMKAGPKMGEQSLFNDDDDVLDDDTKTIEEAHALVTVEDEAEF